MFSFFKNFLVNMILSRLLKIGSLGAGFRKSTDEELENKSLDLKKSGSGGKKPR